jgi:hypothetical protein
VSGSCAVTVGPGVAVSALFAPAAFRLTVAVKGAGPSAARAGSSASRSARRRFRRTSGALTAVPAKGWKLRAWSGACKGAKLACTVPMSAATSVRAAFVRR